MYVSVTLWCVRATTAAVEKQYVHVVHVLSVGVCVCSRSYPACIAHVPYCHLWSVWLDYNLSSIQLQAIQEKVTKNKMCRLKLF
jgi:hypothetical protein